MRILICCYEYPPIGGGGGVGAQQYAESWARAGHDVSVLTSGGLGLPDRETVRRVDIVRVRALNRTERATATFLSMLGYNLLGIQYVLKHRQELGKYDVINTHFSIPSGPVGWVASRILRIPNVLTIIGGDIYDPSKASSPHRHASLRFINRKIMEAADRIIAISSDTKKRAIAHYGVRKPIQVINYGFQPPDMLDEGSVTHTFDPNKFYLIAVGRLVKRKGFDVLLRAMTQLPSEIELLLVGDGPLRDELEDGAKELGIDHRIHLLGYQSRASVCDLMSECDCFVLSSYHEGLGIVVQEAMHVGLPVVATDNGGQVDLIRPRQNGLLVETGSAPDLARAIRYVYEHPKEAAAMGNQNREDIRKLNVDDNSRLYLDVFESALGPETEPVPAGA